MDIIIFFLHLLVLACDCTHPAGCTSWSLGSFCRGTWRLLRSGEVGAPFQYFTAAIVMLFKNVHSLSWQVFFTVSPQNAKTEPPSFRPKEGNWTKVLDSRPMNYCKRASIPGTVSCFKCKINEVADALSLPDNQLLQRSQGWVVAIGNGISPESESWQSNKKKAMCMVRKKIRQADSATNNSVLY